MTDVIDLRSHASFDQVEVDKRGTEIIERISHSVGLTATEITLCLCWTVTRGDHYMHSTVQVLVWPCHGELKEAQEQITVTDFFFNLILLNIVFVWEMFLFVACSS
jgi:hypothetical protein